MEMVTISTYNRPRSLGRDTATTVMAIQPNSSEPSTRHHPYHSIGSRMSQSKNRQRAQDTLGILPDALFQHRRLHSSRQKTLASRKLELLWSYLADWVVVLLMGIAFGLMNRIHGHHREFDLNDPTIQFSHADHERVPMPLLVVLSVVIPAVLIILSSQLLLRSSWDTHIGLLGLALSLSLSLAVTTTAKVTVGRPRPDMLARCQPRPMASNAGSPSYGLSNSSICTAPLDSRDLQDGFRSFPSGHSSTAWAGLAFLSLYLAGKLHLFDRRGHSLKIWISIGPLLGATLVAISRTMDNRHHWQDVVVGSILGALTAWFAYRFYYPSLWSSDCHRPYSPRIPSGLPAGGDGDDDSDHSRSSFSGDVENQLIQQPRPNPVSLPHAQALQSPKPLHPADTASVLSQYSSPPNSHNLHAPKLQ